MIFMTNLQLKIVLPMDAKFIGTVIEYSENIKLNNINYENETTPFKSIDFCFRNTNTSARQNHNKCHEF